jgi:hypothetical protein
MGDAHSAQFLHLIRFSLAVFSMALGPLDVGYFDSLALEISPVDSPLILT